MPNTMMYLRYNDQKCSIIYDNRNDNILLVNLLL